MFDKRLMKMCPESKKYIAGNIFCQWAELMLNAVMIYVISAGVGKAYRRELTAGECITGAIVLLFTFVIRFFTTKKHLK